MLQIRHNGWTNGGLKLTIGHYERVSLVAFGGNKLELVRAVVRQELIGRVLKFDCLLFWWIQAFVSRKR